MKRLIFWGGGGFFFLSKKKKRKKKKKIKKKKKKKEIMMRITITGGGGGGGGGHFCSAVSHRQGRAHTALYKFNNNVCTKPSALQVQQQRMHQTLKNNKLYSQKERSFHISGLTADGHLGGGRGWVGYGGGGGGGGGRSGRGEGGLTEHVCVLAAFLSLSVLFCFCFVN